MQSRDVIGGFLAQNPHDGIKGCILIVGIVWQTLPTTLGFIFYLCLACNRDIEETYLNYFLYVIPRDGRSKKAKQIALKAVISSGDRDEPVITIMLPNED